MVAHDSWAHMVNATFVYAKCSRSERGILWSELGYIAETVTHFNVITSVTEYVGRAAQDLGAIANLNATISNCCLQELPFSGSSYMWLAIRAGARVWKRLDRIFQWFNFMPNIEVQQLNRAILDRFPLLLQMRTDSSLVPKPFKFQNFWISNPSFLQVVRDN